MGNIYARYVFSDGMWRVVYLASRDVPVNDELYLEGSGMNKYHVRDGEDEDE